MASKYSEDFQREPVRSAAQSGLTGCQVASDLGLGDLDLRQVGAGFRDRSGCSSAHGPAPREWALAQREPYSAGGGGGAEKGRALLRESKAVRFQSIMERRRDLSRVYRCRMMQDLKELSQQVPSLAFRSCAQPRVSNAFG